MPLIIFYLSQGLLYDVHFWIGQFSSQDEYATAAYKTVELDTLVSVQMSRMSRHNKLTCSDSLNNTLRVQVSTLSPYLYRSNSRKFYHDIAYNID